MSPRKVAVAALNLILFTCLLGLSVPIRTANAVPIPFGVGMLDGTFRLYDVSFPQVGTPSLILKHEYVIGADFIPGIPDSFTDPTSPQPYAKSVLTTLVPFEAAQGFALTSGSINSGAWFTGLGSLLDACDASTIPPSPGVSSRGALIAARGNCTFDQKWTNMESGGGWDAGILINNVPGLLGGLGGITSDHTIPLILVTQEVGQDLRAASDVTDENGNVGLTFPIFDLVVTWTPNAVPAPGSLALLILGLVYLAVARRSLTLKARA